MSEGSGILIKIFLFGILFVGAISVITITYNIINSNTPEVMGNCVTGGLERIHISDKKIISVDSARRALEPLISEAPAFAGNTLETCGVGYTFEVGDDKYLVCEDGSISKYVTMCKDDTLLDKGTGYISTLKEGVSVSE
ncbi:MAG: hypothetical protein KAT83_03540 [Candidatus Aenigmarchaeota archaeon]|nr:hypothetical protein [Candidatus Aenigmarchaeota archaeon]